MYAIAALARIVRKDAQIEVKVPAANGRKAYSYLREGIRSVSKIKPPQLSKMQVGAIAGGVVATGLIAAGLSVNNDLSKTKADISDQSLIKAGQKVDSDTIKKYQGFKRGELVKRSFRAYGDTFFDHYGVCTGDGYVVGPMSTGKSGGSTLLKVRLERPTAVDTTPYSVVKSKPPSGMTRDKAASVIEAMVGVPVKFDATKTNCESIARLVAEGKGRSTQTDHFNFLTRKIAYTAATLKVKGLETGYSVSEIEKVLKDSNYDEAAISLAFKKSVKKRGKEIAKNTNFKKDSISEDTTLKGGEEFIAQVIDQTKSLPEGTARLAMEGAISMYLLALTLSLKPKESKMGKNPSIGNKKVVASPSN